MYAATASPRGNQVVEAMAQSREKIVIDNQANKTIEETKEAMIPNAGLSIWIQNNTQMGGAARSPQQMRAVAERQSINQTQNFKLNYEQMPRPESEMNSELMTVDIDRIRRQVEQRPNINDFVTGEDQSQATLGTINCSQQRMKQDGSGQTQQILGADEQPSMTTHVVNHSVKVHEQRVVFNNSSDLMMDQQRHESPMLVEFEPSEAYTKDAGSQEGAQPYFMKAHHHQSQSLENLPNFQEIEKQEDLAEGEAPSQLQANHMGIMSVQSAQFDISETDGGVILLGGGGGDKDLSVSEFAFTEDHKEQAELHASQQTIAEQSMTICEPIECSVMNQESVGINDSVTDTQTQKAAQLQKHDSLNHEFNISQRGELVSQTEKTGSVHNSIDARRSECVQLDSFAEENSADWNRQAVLPQTAPHEAQGDYSQKQISSQRRSKTNSMGGLSVGAPPSNAMGSVVIDSEYMPVYDNDYHNESQQDPAGPKTEVTPLLSVVGYESDNRQGTAPLRQVGDKVINAENNAQSELMGQGDLFNSVERAELGVVPSNPSQDYLNHEFNAESNNCLQVQDHLDEMGSQIETVGVQPSGSGMVIIEESPWVNTSRPMHDCSDFASVGTRMQKKHSREFKSFDIKAKTQVVPQYGTERESGIEQYESDDNVDRIVYGSSIQQTSITNEGPLNVHKFSHPHSSAMGEDNDMIDSLAFDTVQQKAGHEMTISYAKEEDGADDVEAGEQDINPLVAQEAAISVLDESDQASPAPQQDEFQPMRSTQHVMSNDDLSEAHCSSPKSCRTQDSKQLVQPMQAQSSIAPVSKEINILDESESVRDRMLCGSNVKEKEIQINRRKADKKKGTKKNSRSPKRNSQSPQHTRKLLNSKKKSVNVSKSPPGVSDSKYIIKNGRVTVQNAQKQEQKQRNSLGERHQFPIRKSNYNPRTVEQMLMNKHSFQESERMMQRMKTRIQKYSVEMVPFAQQYYMAMQHQEPLPLRQQVAESMIQSPPADDNISFDEPDSTILGAMSTLQRLRNTPDSALVDFPTQGIANRKTSNQFLKNGDRTRAESPWTVDGINNIQVATSAEFPDSRANSIQKMVTATPISRAYPQDQFLGAQSLEAHQQRQLMDQQRQAPGTAIAIQRDSRSGLMTRGSDLQIGQNDSDVVRIEENKDGKLIDQSFVTPISIIPQTQSEFRFRAKKPNNRRLVPANRDLKNQPESQRKATIETDQSIYFNNKASTRSSFYPQENLSFLLQANNGGNAPSDSISMQHGGGNINLAQKFTKNTNNSTGKKKPRMSKNQTMEKIYAEINQGKAAKMLATNVKIRAGQKHNQLNSMPEQQQRFRVCASLYDETDVNAYVSSSKERVTLPCRTAGNNSQRNLAQWPGREQKNSSLQPSEYQQRSIQDSGRLFKQRLSTRERLNGSVMQKFQRWLDKGQPHNYPTSNSTLPSRSCRRNLKDRLKATSARGNVIGGASSQTPNQLVDTQTEIDVGDVIMESFEVRRSSMQGEAMKKYGSMNMTNAINAKILEDPRLGDSIDQRTKRLRQMMKNQFREDFISVQQNNPIRHKNNLFSSHENATPQHVMGKVGHHDQVRQRGIGRIMVKTNVSSGERHQPLQQNKHLSQQQQQLLRQSQQARQQKPQQTSEAYQREQLHGKINNLSQIYAVPKGKKQRIDFLRENYVKQRLFDGAVPAKDVAQNRYGEDRNSHSPRQQYQPDQQQKSAGKSHKNEHQQFKMPHQSHKQPQNKRSDSAEPTRSSRVEMHEQEITQAQQFTNGRLRSQGETPGPAERMDVEESYSHPQITLNVGYSQPPAQHESQEAMDVEDDHIEVEEDQVNIDRESTQVLSQPVPLQDMDSEHQIDHLQERDIVDDEGQTQDVPVVVAEDEVTDQPGKGREQDPILGEQSISEDEAGEIAQKQAMEQNNQMSFRIDVDSYPTHRSQPPALLQENPIIPQVHQQSVPESQGDDYKLEFDEDEPSLKELQPLSSDHHQDYDVASDGNGPGLQDIGHDSEQEDDEEDEDDDEDYYADDKFVYEDVAEDPSSEDPEQKFLKQQAVLQEQEASHRSEMQEQDDDEYSDYPEAADDESDDEQSQSALMQGVSRDAQFKQQKISASYNDRPTAAGLNELGSYSPDSEDADDDDEDVGGEDYENEDFENDQNDNEDAYSAN